MQFASIHWLGQKRDAKRFASVPQLSCAVRRDHGGIDVAVAVPEVFEQVRAGHVRTKLVVEQKRIRDKLDFVQQ